MTRSKIPCPACGEFRLRMDRVDLVRCSRCGHRYSIECFFPRDAPTPHWLVMSPADKKAFEESIGTLVGETVGERHPAAVGQTFCGMILPPDYVGGSNQMCIRFRDHDGKCGVDGEEVVNVSERVHKRV